LGSACATLQPEQLSRVIIAYEPVWAIGTGKNANAGDAAEVTPRDPRRVDPARLRRPRVLYGGSVNEKNIKSLLAEPEIDGVLVGGAAWIRRGGLE
jgi:triosephosphate isomerase